MALIAGFRRRLWACINRSAGVALKRLGWISLSRIHLNILWRSVQVLQGFFSIIDLEQKLEYHGDLRKLSLSNLHLENLLLALDSGIIPRCSFL